VADFAAESPERSWNTSNPAAFGGSEASAEVARRPVATRGASTAASGEHGSMDVDVGGDVFDAMSKALDSDVFETMQLEDEADASSKIAPAAAGDRGLDSAGQSALPLKDDAGVANDPLLEWRAGRARSDERHRNERKTEQLGQAIAGPKAALGLHGKEIADLERKSLETPRRKEAADGAGATGAPSLGAGAAPVAPAALATLATPATPAALRGLGSGPKLPGARVNRLSSRNQGFIRSYTPCDSTSAGASAFLASASRRKRACDVLEGKASEEVEDPTATMGSYRSMRPRRGATTRARSVQAKESLDRLVVRLQGSRGRACSPIFLPDTQLCRKPREEEIRDYDVGFALLATNGTLEQLEAALQSGKSPNACTRFGESLLHSLARRGDTHVDKLRLLLK